MIFLTVGGQLPFDRLVGALDKIVPDLSDPVFAQIGCSSFKPVYFQAVSFIDAIEYSAAFRKARVIVAHAGIGTIITAKKMGKPIIVMPRSAELGEHRNEHQLATVAQLGSVKGIYVANNSSDLLSLLSAGDLVPQDPESSKSRESLIGFLRDQMEQAAQARGRTKAAPEPALLGRRNDK